MVHALSMRIILLTTLFFVVACSKGGVSAERKRPLSFYAPIVNPAADFDRAADRMSALKVITSDQKYVMRYALFDNGKFYYEVANLGHGNGTWQFRDGIINLFASRSFFDLDIDLSAAGATDDRLEMNFIDRYGSNSAAAQVHAPSAQPMSKLPMPVNSAL